ncbi:hypothetical protein HYW46_05250 [Candidatus Daviesbacteria bacterium]|nr:hypothetical protein [Candidatus Daviesbacteria bacterium]
MSNKERENFAYIKSSVCDMGQYGYSWCSACHTELDIRDIFGQRLSIIGKITAGNLVEPAEVHCPNPDCAKPLKSGGIYIPQGGSDF